MADPTNIALLDIPTVATRLGVSERFVRRLVEERRIPFHKIGKYVRFETNDINQWVRAQRVNEIRR